MNFLVFLSFFSLSSPTIAAVYNVLDFGARADGTTDSTRPFLSAWASACASTGPCTILVPRGSYLVKTAVFKGPCKNDHIAVKIDGTIVAPSRFAAAGDDQQHRWLLFDSVQGISLQGGTIDGHGSILWACRASGHHCRHGYTSLAFHNANDVLINGLKSVNSQLYHIVIQGSRNVTVQGVKILAPGDSPNTDGIHVQDSTDVIITTTGIHTGDDCISIGPGTMNLWIEKVDCGPGHGISIGSLGKGLNEPGVQNVTVKWVTFTGTQNGLRIKSWGRPSNGFVRGVVFEHAVMKNVQNPIIIDQNYCPGKKHCPGQLSGVKISHVIYRNIQGTSATPIAVKFDCSASNPCKELGLQDVKLTYLNRSAESSCKHADGTTSGLIVPPSCL
ncbi:hypothetical protein ACLOJK_008873 [Asimina triloba]